MNLAKNKQKIKIPEGWKEVRMGDVCTIINGKTPLRSNGDFWDKGDVPWFTIDDVRRQGRIINSTSQCITKKAIEDTGIKLVPKDSVLLCCTASVGEYAYTNISLATNQQFNALIVKDKTVLNSKYLYFVASLLDVQLKKMMGTTTFGFVSIAKLESIKILLPPLSTQNKIAEILGAVDEKIEKVGKIIVESESIKMGLMHIFFSLGIKGKKELKLGEICNFATGKLNSNQAEQDGKYPFFTCSQDTFRINKFSFDCEAILLAGNNAAGIYSVKYYNGKFDAYQRTYVITVKDKLESDYLYLKNFLEWQLSNLRKKSVGTSTKFLTIKLLLNLKIAIPKIEEQKYFSDILSAVDNKILIYKKIKNNLVQLKKGLATDLLSGGKLV